MANIWNLARKLRIMGLIINGPIVSIMVLENVRVFNCIYIYIILL